MDYEDFMDSINSGEHPNIWVVTHPRKATRAFNNRPTAVKYAGKHGVVNRPCKLFVEDYPE